jgi:hypothetical protein
MKYSNIKNLLNILLIITLVVQPVMFTYAMASMSHGHHVSMAMSHDMNTHHAMQIDDASSSSSSVMLDDCCKTPACSPAVLTSSLDVQHIPAVHHDLSFNVSMMSVDLPSENKPPRR